MLKLYGGAFSRASIVQWDLEELEVPYEFVMLDMKAGELQKSIGSRQRS
jgi:glutathione S-transferase